MEILIFNIFAYYSITNTRDSLFFTLIIGPTNSVWSHTSDDIKHFLVPPTKGNKRDVFLMCRDKFDHVRSYSIKTNFTDVNDDFVKSTLPSTHATLMRALSGCRDETLKVPGSRELCVKIITSQKVSFACFFLNRQVSGSQTNDLLPEREQRI